MQPEPRAPRPRPRTGTPAARPRPAAAGLSRMRLRWLAVLATLLLAACGGQDPGPAAGPGPLVVFAAASLAESMEAAAQAFGRLDGQLVQVAYAGSPALARQIE